MIAPSRRTGSLLAVCAASIVALHGRIAAQPIPRTSSDSGANPRSDADDATALPGEARRVAREEDDDSDALLLLPRLALAAPRLVVRTAMGAAVTGARVEERHHLIDRAEDLFFDDTRTYGVFPTVFYETGFNPNVGARAVHRNLFGEGVRLQLRAGYAGADRQIYEGRGHTGHLLPGGRLSLHVEYVRAHEDFYGVGNADLGELDSAAGPYDALAPPAAVRTRFSLEEVIAEVGASAELSDRWRLDLVERFRLRELGSLPSGSTPAVTAVYARDSLVGLGGKRLDAYTELGLGFDGARSDRPDVPDDLPSSGLRFDAWTGLQSQVEAPRAVFATLGADLQPYFDLYRGDRVLRLRFRVASVIGPLDTVPFVDLPRLGGSPLLRGYSAGRFRGRLTTLATVEYRYPVQERIAAYLFVDAGRAYARIEDLSPEGLRMGFGGGLQIYGASAARVRLQLASSIDGGLFFHFKADTTDEHQRTL